MEVKNFVFSLSSIHPSYSLLFSQHKPHPRCSSAVGSLAQACPPAQEEPRPQRWAAGWAVHAAAAGARCPLQPQGSVGGTHTATSRTQSCSIHLPQLTGQLPFVDVLFHMSQYFPIFQWWHIKDCLSLMSSYFWENLFSLTGSHTLCADLSLGFLWSHLFRLLETWRSCSSVPGATREAERVTVRALENMNKQMEGSQSICTTAEENNQDILTPSTPHTSFSSLCFLFP